MWCAAAAAYVLLLYHAAPALAPSAQLLSGAAQHLVLTAQQQSEVNVVYVCMCFVKPIVSGASYNGGMYRQAAFRLFDSHTAQRSRIGQLHGASYNGGMYATAWQVSGIGASVHAL
jgi:hypothetical protein